MRIKGVLVTGIAGMGLAIAMAAGQGCSSTVEYRHDAGAQKDASDEPDAMFNGDSPCLGNCDASYSDAPSCVGLQCSVNKSCSNGGHTTLTGKVYDPAGVNPLYNATVFVPADPQGRLLTIEPGLHGCNSCDVSIGQIVSAALTNEHGEFTLSDVPTGKDVPLVVQVGKWRREITIPETTDCENTEVADGEARLPRNQTEGDMPQMAVLTGGCDNLGCFMKRLGIDDAEFTNPEGTGRVHVYKGTGGVGVTGGGEGICDTASCPLWASAESLAKYDLLMLTCECDEYNNTKPDDAKQRMFDYLSSGGKMFGSHYHYTWFKNGPPDFRALADWTGKSGSTYHVNTSFAKGQALRDWLEFVGAIKVPDSDVIALDGPANDIGKVAPEATSWIYSGTQGGADESTRYMSVNTPIGGIGESDAGVTYCGRGVESDIHVVGSESGDMVPSACKSHPLSPQEAALEFLFFDLSSCVTDDKLPPPIPH